jgi:ABC-type branched-subunit amino acid transport system ATPase component
MDVTDRLFELNYGQKLAKGRPPRSKEPAVTRRIGGE